MGSTTYLVKAAGQPRQAQRGCKERGNLRWRVAIRATSPRTQHESAVLNKKKKKHERKKKQERKKHEKKKSVAVRQKSKTNKETDEREYY